MTTLGVGPNAPDLMRLLDEARLPTDDLGDGTSRLFAGAYADGRPVGVVGIEVHGSDGLLRSLAVTADQRGSGTGAALVAEAVRLAAGAGVTDLYLLTTTAAEFFARQGFSACPRSDAPEAIRATPQFAGICPGSAAFMHRRVAAP